MVVSDDVTQARKNAFSGKRALLALTEVMLILVCVWFGFRAQGTQYLPGRCKKAAFCYKYVWCDGHKQ